MPTLHERTLRLAATLDEADPLRTELVRLAASSRAGDWHKALFDHLFKKNAPLLKKLVAEATKQWALEDGWWERGLPTNRMDGMAEDAYRVLLLVAGGDLATRHLDQTLKKNGFR